MEDRPKVEDIMGSKEEVSMLGKVKDNTVVKDKDNMVDKGKVNMVVKEQANMVDNLPGSMEAKDQVNLEDRELVSLEDKGSMEGRGKEVVKDNLVAKCKVVVSLEHRGSLVVKDNLLVREDKEATGLAAQAELTVGDKGDLVVMEISRAKEETMSTKVLVKVVSKVAINLEVMVLAAKDLILNKVELVDLV